MQKAANQGALTLQVGKSRSVSPLAPDLGIGLGFVVGLILCIQ